MSALQHFYAQQQQQTNLSPIFLSQFQHHLMARAAAMAHGGLSPTSPTLTSPNQEIDMSLKNVGLGSPPMRPLKRTLEPKSQGSSPSKKAKISPGGLPRKKASRKLAFDEDKTSPVSGTIIRELAEGEEVPAIRKGTQKSWKICRHCLLTFFTFVQVTFLLNSMWLKWPRRPKPSWPKSRTKSVTIVADYVKRCTRTLSVLHSIGKLFFVSRGFDCHAFLMKGGIENDS